VDALFVADDSSEQVAEKRAAIEMHMEAAREYLNREEEPRTGCECHYNGRNRHCTTFAYSHPEVPEYSVHDIVRIGSSKKKLTYFVDHHILTLDDVPEDFELGNGQANQVRAHKLRRPIIDVDAIRAALSDYSYPLYFFDYETFAPAIPAFDGFSPYQRIPFQFSLHVLPEPGAPLQHVEYLHEEASEPTARVAELLSKHIMPGGRVVVWYAPFERGVNAEMAQRQPALSGLIERINGQVRDLRDIFADQLYVHPGFRGSTSIKAVLPVLCPELTYDGLAIREGATASNAWWQMIAPMTPETERQAIAKALREYCALDTYAMYAIWRELWKVIGEPSGK
jgi:hypothetical protein